MTAFHSVVLEVAGLGFIFYSPFSAAEIQEGEDYLEVSFNDPSFVEAQAVEGRIVGVSTGSPGRFLLDFFWGYPSSEIMKDFEYKLRLGVEVRDRTLNVRDLYDLMRWSAKCPEEQSIALRDGFYHITLLSKDSESGILGDDQKILVFLNQLIEMPKLKFDGIPTLCY